MDALIDRRSVLMLAAATGVSCAAGGSFAATAFVAADAAMIAVDFYCIHPIGLCPTAERVQLKDGLIIEDELYFDTRPFEALARARSSAQGSK